MKRKNKEYVIGYDIGGPEGLDCAVVAEKLPDGRLSIVDVQFRDKAEEGTVEGSWKTRAKKAMKDFTKEINSYKYAKTLNGEEVKNE